MGRLPLPDSSRDTMVGFPFGRSVSWASWHCGCGVGPSDRRRPSSSCSRLLLARDPDIAVRARPSHGGCRCRSDPATGPCRGFWNDRRCRSNPATNCATGCGSNPGTLRFSLHDRLHGDSKDLTAVPPGLPNARLGNFRVPFGLHTVGHHQSAGIVVEVEVFPQNVSADPTLDCRIL